MKKYKPGNRPKRYLSLRWKALIVLSVVLILVNASLAFFAYRQSAEQFEQQQARVRAGQIRQFHALLNNNYEQMFRLANMVPLLVADEPERTFAERLQRAFENKGYLLDLEWDIRSVHWISTPGTPISLWPPTGRNLPSTVVQRLPALRKQEHITSLISCEPKCLQYVAVPLLSQGSFAGALVLGRSLADTLLTFNALTGAEVAIIIKNGIRQNQVLDKHLTDRFPAITHRERIYPILYEAEFMENALSVDPTHQLVRYAGETFEIFRLAALAAGVDAWAINQVTAQREVINRATSNSILLGILGLILSETLLLLVIQTPVSKLRKLANLLPLLAENRYQELHAQLPMLRSSLSPSDEMDLMVNTVRNLTSRMQQLQKEQMEAEARLIWLADHDALTNLFNRRRFKNDFRRIHDQAQRYEHQGVLLFFDLDQFKDVNDLSGHHVGDALLKQVAVKLQQMARKSDLLARLGGDEFALALPEANAEQAIATAERLQNAIQSVIVQGQGRRHQVSASIGIVLFPEPGVELEQLLADADLAMYQAKEKGRGRWHLFSRDDQVREQVNARVLWSERIAEALQEDRFELHFQPIMELNSGSLRRMEVLLRMRDTKGELVYPNNFIPVAEKTGQIRAIDHWVLARSITVIQAHPEYYLSVNLSASALEDPALLSILENLLKQPNVDPARLTFEITETIAIINLQTTTRLMQGIRELGCHFALDDFGSGFASYAYLRQLPVDDIKIDGAFIRNITHSREDRIFVRATTDMAHGMDKRVVAEFVENEEILNILREIGVDYAQGYHIGRPGPLPIPPGDSIPPRN